jgi:uncharacterized protein YbaR (Trm112 family)
VVCDTCCHASNVPGDWLGRFILCQKCFCVYQAAPALPETLSRARPSDPVEPNPPLDSSRRYLLLDCPICDRRLRVPREEAGCVYKCPVCRLFFRVPGSRPRNDGIPIVLQLSAQLFTWPMVCSCCTRPYDTTYYADKKRDGFTVGDVLLANVLNGALDDRIDAPCCWDASSMQGGTARRA